MRERTTWNRDEIKRVAAMPKQADPYLMNQDHVSQNPRADKYMNGTPSSWAEDVHSPNEWEKEYSNGQTKRDEIGLAELRPETFSHPEKTASNQLLVKKADLTVKVARLMLGNKVAEEVVEDQAVALMALPDSDLIETFQRLAQEEGQQQQGQGGEEPPAQQQQQAGMQQQSAYEQASQQCMEAMQQGDQQKMQSAMQQMVQEAMKQQQGSQADFPGGQFGKNNPVASAKKKAQQGQQDQGQGQQEPPAQQQQQAGQQQQDQQQAGMQDQQQQAGMQQQALQQQIQALQEQIQQMQQQSGQQQMPGPQMGQQGQQGQEPVLASDDMLLDEMLAPAGGGADMSGLGEIELEPASMDVGEIALGPEDDVLKTLFANQETQDAQDAQQHQQGQQGQGQQVQASAFRSPSSRTVGTRPTVGVSKVGGASASQIRTASNDIDKLSNLWSSAPDVREHFGLK